MPNKTIYVSDGDLPIYQRAQELAGGNLSAAISSALKRYVDVEEGRHEGFEEITVRVGIGTGRKVRFVGVLVGMWGSTGSNPNALYRVFRSRGGKYALHVERGPESTMVDAEGKPAGWRGHLGIGNIRYGFAERESTLEVFDSLEALRAKIPQELYDLVARSADQPAVEDLDI